MATVEERLSDVLQGKSSGLVDTPTSHVMLCPCGCEFMKHVTVKTIYCPRCGKGAAKRALNLGAGHED